MKNIFWKTHAQNVLKELVPGQCMMKPKRSIPLGQQSEMLWNLFILQVQVEVYQSIRKLMCWPLNFISYKTFLKSKGSLEYNSLPNSFSACSLKKIFLLLYFINWPNFIAWLPLLLEILVNISIVIIQYPVCDVLNFEINHSFLIKSFFYTIKTSGQKYKYLKNEKRF